MPEVAYLSKTGEVKIPLKVRTRLGLQAGEKFQVETSSGDILLQRLGLPAEEQVAEFLEWTKKHRNDTPDRFVIGSNRPKKKGGATRRKKGRGSRPHKTRPTRRR